MTTINSSSPASIWLQAQTTAPTTNIQAPSTDTQTAVAVTDSVQLSEAARAKLNAEVAELNNSGNAPPVEPQGGGNGSPMPLGNGSGNDPPRPPDEEV